MKRLLVTLFAFLLTASASFAQSALSVNSSTGAIVGPTSAATFKSGNSIQPLDDDLTAISALAGTHTIYYRSATGTWTAVTIGTGLDFTGATLSATGSGEGIAAVVDDTSPQLGGNLDLNSHVITGMVIGTNIQAHSAALDTIAANTGTLNLSGITLQLGPVADLGTPGAGDFSSGTFVWPKDDVLDAMNFAADAGSTDTYAASLSPAISGYVTGTHYRFKANTANTGAASINFNSVGAKTIKKAAGGITTDLATNDIRAGQWVDLVYDGTNMQMQSLLGNAPSGGGTIASTLDLFEGDNAGNAVASGILASNVMTLDGDQTATGHKTIATLTGTTVDVSSLTPSSNDGAPLGTSSLQWSDLFLASGAVINFNNGNVVFTHSSGILTEGTGELRITTPGTNAASVPTNGSTNTLTNKRVTARITTITSSATPTVNTDNADCVTITALAAAITSMTTNLTGTPVNFDQLEYRIKDDGTARAITWGASFASGTGILPTTTTLSKVLHVYFEWDSVQSKWVCASTGSEP